MPPNIIHARLAALFIAAFYPKEVKAPTPRIPCHHNFPARSNRHAPNACFSNDNRTTGRAILQSGHHLPGGRQDVSINTVPKTASRPIGRRHMRLENSHAYGLAAVCFFPQVTSDHIVQPDHTNIGIKVLQQREPKKPLAQILGVQFVKPGVHPKFFNNLQWDVDVFRKDCQFGKALFSSSLKSSRLALSVASTAWVRSSVLRASKAMIPYLSSLLMI